MKNRLTKLLYLITINIVWAQQDAQFSQYMFSTQNISSSEVGLSPSLEATLIHRSQWLGYSPTTGSGKAPTSQYLNINAPVKFLNGGLGAFVINDQLGNTKNLYAKLSYAYHIKLKESILSLGLSGGFYNLSLNSSYIYNDANDPNINTSNFQQTKPDLGAGISLKNEKYSIAVGANHINKVDFKNNTTSFVNLSKHFYLLGLYNFKLNDNLNLKPSILFKTDNNLKNLSFDLNSNLHIKSKYWLGMSYRRQEALVALLGISLLKDNSLKLGYAFDYVIKGAKAKNYTSHEVMVSYQLPIYKSGNKPIIRTPRYRYN
ncbi:MAG: type IX secretion system membrane protein PorP/SprF [Cytophagales bacterium]